MALRHWLQLSLTDGIGPILARRLIDASGGVESACAANTRVLQQIDGIGSHKAGNILTSLHAAAGMVDAELERAAAAAAKLICPDDEIYPVLLKSIPDPPLVLY